MNNLYKLVTSSIKGIITENTEIRCHFCNENYIEHNVQNVDEEKC